MPKKLKCRNVISITLHAVRSVTITSWSGFRQKIHNVCANRKKLSSRGQELLVFMVHPVLSSYWHHQCPLLCLPVSCFACVSKYAALKWQFSVLDLNFLLHWKQSVTLEGKFWNGWKALIKDITKTGFRQFSQKYPIINWDFLLYLCLKLQCW